jgi:hypothetical protein
MSAMCRLRVVCALVGATVGILGCAADRVAGVKLAPSNAIGIASRADISKQCKFKVKLIEDRREHKNLGNVAFTRVDGEGFEHWFAHGMQSLPGYSTEPARIELHIEVLKAHISTQSTYKLAHIIVKVDTAVEGLLPTSKTYRGSDGSMNWSSSESEVQTAFDSALTDLKRQISVDLSKVCKTI